MAVGNMQYGANNNSVGDPTTLESTASPQTLGVQNASFGRDAIVGRATNQGNGVAGYSNGCSFPEGCNAGAGVYGENTSSGHGIRGISPGVGVGGYSSGASTGVDGQSTAGDGVSGRSQQRNGVQGVSASRSASGVYGENLS